MLEKFVKISGVYVPTGTRHNKTIFNCFIIKLMQYKDTAQQAFLIIWFNIYFIIYLLFTW